MLAIILTVLAVAALIALVLDIVPRGVGMAAMVIGIAGAVAATAVPMFVGPTLTTDTYALRPLTPEGAQAPSYLSVSGGATGYSYDDNGTLRIGSATGRQKVEVREDGDAQPRVEVVHREYGNTAIAPWSMGYDEKVIFHVPAGSALSSASAH